MEDISMKSLDRLNTLDGPNVKEFFEAFCIFMEEQQKIQAIERDITKALQGIVNKFGRFNGCNITKFLQVYTCEMETCQIPEAKMISSFYLAIEPGIHRKVKRLLERGVETWSKSQELLKKEFIDANEDKITKRQFLDWIELQPGTHMDLYEFQKEFEKRFYQLSSSERQSLDAIKIELFLNGLDDAMGDKLFILLADESTESGCTNNWEELKEATILLAKQQRAQAKGVGVWSKKSSTLASISSLSIQGINLEKREIEQQLEDFEGGANFLQMKESGSFIKDGEGKNKDFDQIITMEGQNIKKIEGNMELKDLEINDNKDENYGYSTLNMFMQVDDGNLDGTSHGVIQHIEITQGYDVSQGCIQEEMKDVLQEYIQEEMIDISQDNVAKEDCGIKGKGLYGRLKSSMESKQQEKRCK
uniref:Predicted protein n=1 Tax=Physcomitrium patens TaxID=3218 RepID=A9U5V9_PHYPA